MCTVVGAAKFHSSLFPTAEDRGELTSSSILEINLSLKCQLSSSSKHTAAPGKIQEGASHRGGLSKIRWVQMLWLQCNTHSPSLLEAGWAQKIVQECLVCLIRVISPAVSLKSALMLLAGKYLL